MKKKVKLVYRSLDKEFMVRKLLKKLDSVGQPRRPNATAPTSTEELLVLTGTTDKISPKKKKKEYDPVKLKFRDLISTNAKECTPKSPQRKKV